MYGGTSGQGWLGVAAFLVICGLIIGLALVGSDLINPISSWAESQRYQAETRQIVEREAVDIEQYKRLREAETQAEILRLNGELVQQEQLHQAEIQRLNAEMQQTQRMYEEEIRQAQEMAALKLRLVNIAVIIVVSGIGVSLIVLSLGVTKRLWRSPQPSSQWVQANLRLQPPLLKTWQTVSREYEMQRDNGGGAHKSLQTF